MDRLRIASLLALALALPAEGSVVVAADDFTGYTGAGLAPGGVEALDSLAWRVEGASDGDSRFGDVRPGGDDFGRGLADAPVTAGGVYAFALPGDARGVGVQATGSDFTPGALVRRAVNATGDWLSQAVLGFDLWVRNDGARSTRVHVEALVEGADTGWLELPALELLTPAAATPDAGWIRFAASAALPFASLAPGAGLQIRWGFDDAAGGGARDEIAIAALTLLAEPVAVPAPVALGLAAPFLALAGARGRSLPFLNGGARSR